MKTQTKREPISKIVQRAPKSLRKYVPELSVMIAAMRHLEDMEDALAKRLSPIHKRLKVISEAPIDKKRDEEASEEARGIANFLSGLRCRFGRFFYEVEYCLNHKRKRRTKTVTP
jgi:hypothetical protein